MATIDYASPTPRRPKRKSRTVLLLIGDFLLLVVCAMYAAIMGDNPKIGSKAELICLGLAELAVPVTVFLFIFLLGWMASDYSRSRKIR